METSSPVILQSQPPTTAARIQQLWCHSCKFEFYAPLQSECVQCERCQGDFCEQIGSAETDPRDFVPFGEESPRSESSQTSQTMATTTATTPTQQRQGISFSNRTLNNSNVRTTPLTSFMTSAANNRASYSISMVSGNGGQQTGFGGVFGLNQILSNLFPVTSQRSRSSIFSGTLLSGIGEQQSSYENILDFIMRNDTNVYGTPPANEDSVTALPKVRFCEQINQKNAQQTQTECVVCKEDFEADDELMKMPCGHLFHPDCLLTWLKIHNSCPTCRHELPTDNTDYERRKTESQQQQQQQQDVSRNSAGNNNDYNNNPSRQ